MKSTNLIKQYSKHKIWINWFGNKIPIGSSTDPSTWSTFEKLSKGKAVGIVFSPEKLLLGIDIDHCLVDGKIVHEKKEEIASLLLEADTYTEYSPSKTGLHLFLALTAPLTLGRNKVAPFEAYSSGRYFTVTGEPYIEDKEVRMVTPEEALRILSLTGHDWSGTEVAQPITTPIGDDEILLEKIFASANGEEFRRLFEGDISKYKGDRSSADMALVSQLAFWTGGNAVQMDRIWLKSVLSNRDKAVTRKDYRPRTIAKAIRECKEFYKGAQTVTTSHNVSKTPDSLVFVNSADVLCKPINWLWRDKIAKGKVTLIAGDPGLGKSQVTIHLASVISNGGELPGGHGTNKGKVLFFSAEDDPADTITPRLIACGANLRQIHLFSMAKKGGKEVFFDLSKDVGLLANTLKSEPGVSLIIVDPITAFLGETDSYVNAEVRALLHQLSKVAAEFEVAVVCVTHFNKSSNGGPMNKITGSLAFVAAARAAFVVIKDEQDEKRRLFLPVKNNIAEDVSGFAFKIESVEMEVHGTPIKTSKVLWEKEPVSISAIEAMREKKGGVDNSSVEWVEGFLRERPSGVLFNDLVFAAKRQGISARTLYRIQKETFIDVIDNGWNKPKTWKLIDMSADIEE